MSSYEELKDKVKEVIGSVDEDNLGLEEKKVVEEVMFKTAYSKADVEKAYKDVKLEEGESLPGLRKLAIPGNIEDAEVKHINVEGGYTTTEIEEDNKASKESLETDKRTKPRKDPNNKKGKKGDQENKSE